jgi:16S rRNA G966 N2-methylase RsmD
MPEKGTRRSPQQSELVSHINHAIPAIGHTPMYLMHKWWARKPHNVVSEYIEHYSSPSDIVLDPFCGSGVTPLEAIKLGRKAIGIDLDPVATFISRMTGIPCKTDLIKREFDEIRESISKTILSYYETNCPKCNAKANTVCAIWKEGETNPAEIRFFCESCNKVRSKKPDDQDLRRLSKIGKMPIPFWHPEVTLTYKAGKGFMKKEKSNTLDDLFTKRNLTCLSILFNEINKISNEVLRDLFLFRFTSMVHLASKMTPVRPTRPLSSFWAIQSYWIPPINMESNVWDLFESAITGRQGLVAGKEDSNKQIATFKEASNFEDLQKSSNILLLTQSALEMTNIPADSVDYVFTDPPYGGAVQYFELSTLWCSWLAKSGNYNLDYHKEITINDNQDKDFDYYHKMLRSAFQEIYRVLKPTKYMTVTFHNTDIQIYNSILNAAIISGFDLEKVVYQPPARPSAKQRLQPFGSAVGDYYIRFKKPEVARQSLASDASIDTERFERIIVECVKKIIAERGEPTPYGFIINSYSMIYDELKKNGYLFTASTGIDQILKKHLNDEFTTVPIKDPSGRNVGRGWWFKDPSTVPFLERVPLLERVEKAVINVLNKNVFVTFDDIVQEIFLRFPNALTPETSSIESVLKEYAEKVKGGMWRLKPSVKMRESEHDKIIEDLCILGEKAGFKVYGDTPSRRFKLSFPMPADKLARVAEIDCLWYKGDKIHYEYEVENSTGISEAMIRGTNIPYTVTRLIVIPEERENLLVRKVKEPALAERIEKDGWKFVRYEDFYSFFAKSKRLKSIKANDVLDLNKPPKTTRSSSLDEYVKPPEENEEEP